MKLNIIYGVANISEVARIAIRNELTSAGYEVVDDSIVREIKSGIDQAVSSYARPEQLVLTLSSSLEPKNPFTINDLLRYQKEVPNIKIVFVVSEDMKGSELLKDMSDNGMYLAMYSRETSAKMIKDLIVTGRTVEEAKRYYGVSGVKNVSKQITIDGAVAHMTQPAKNPKEYIERIRWVRGVLGSEDAFVACVRRLPDEIKDVLAQNKTYYPYVEDYVVTKASTIAKSDEKSGGGLLGKFRGKNGKNDKAVKEELVRQTAEEKAAAEAEKRAEAERIAAEKKAEAERLEAEKKAERERKEAEKAEARERKEAEKKAERERKEAERLEAQKRAEELRAQQEEERKKREAEEAEKRARQEDFDAEFAILQKQAAEKKAEEDALRQERLRIEAEAKAKAEMEYKMAESERRRAEAEQRRAEAEERAAAKAAAKAERAGGLAGYATGGAKKSPAVTVGREDICIYSLRHGTGTSYVAAAIANYLSKNRKGDVSLVLNDTEYTEEIASPRLNILPWTREGEAFNKSNYIVHDIGVYGEMTPDRRVSLQRASTKIILCKADGRFLSRLADHVESIDTRDLIFIFTEIPVEWEKRVYDVMDFTRNVYCIPTFYALAPNAQVLKVFNEIFKRK